MNGRQRLLKAGTDAGKRYGRHQKINAYLGKGDGNGTILFDTSAAPGVVWCYRDVAGVRESFTAMIYPDSNIPYQDNPDFETSKIPVVCFYEGDSPILWVTGQASQEGVMATGGATLIQQLITAVSYPAAANLSELRVAPNFPTTDKRVYISAGNYYDAHGNWTRFGEDWYDFTSAIGALTSGQHQMAVLYLDVTTGNLGALYTTAATGSDKALWGAADTDAMSILSTYLPLGAIHLYYGQGAIIEDDIYRGADDPRVLFNTPARTGYLAVTSSSATLTATTGKLIRVNYAGAVAITLPAASAVPANDVWFVFKDESGAAGTNTITISRAGADTIDGATSATITTNYGKIGLYSDGVSKWFTV